LDLAGKFGRFTAHDEYVEFEFKEGKIFNKNKPCKNAIEDDHLVVVFEKTEKDNPIVNGILLYEGGLSSTDFYEVA